MWSYILVYTLCLYEMPGANINFRLLHVTLPAVGVLVGVPIVISSEYVN